MPMLIETVTTGGASLADIFAGAAFLLNMLGLLGIVWGGGRLLGKIESNVDRTVKVVDDLEKRVGTLEGRKT